jgi:hypothetical protein
MFEILVQYLSSSSTIKRASYPGHDQGELAHFTNQKPKYNPLFVLVYRNDQGCFIFIKRLRTYCTKSARGVNMDIKTDIKINHGKPHLISLASTLEKSPLPDIINDNNIICVR